MSTALAQGTPLRGRDPELERIREILEHGRGTGSALLAIEGMPGIGKTRLLQEAALLAERLGYDVNPGRHTGGYARCPRPSGPRLVILDGTGPLPRQRRHPAAGPTGTPGGRRPGLHGGPARTAVPAGRHGDRARTVWLLAHRPGEGMAAPAAALLGGEPRGRSERLTLGPLGASDALRLAQDVLGADPSPALARLVDQAGGHPRLLIDLLTGLREEGGVRIAAGEAELLSRRLPERVALRVRSTLERYSGSCRQLLCVAAVLGDEVVYEELALMMRTSVSALLPVLEEVRATGVVRDRGGRAVFHSPLLRRLLADSLPDTVRAALEREAQSLRTARAAKRRPEAVPAQPAPHAPERTGLTETQRALVGLVADGLTNQQIGRRLALSPHTVNYHLRKLFKRYGVSSRIDLLQAVSGTR
ncbi:helix-turn-helix transcriptional regulator [Streptomyces roseoviridis]|uniref:LuxR C-terminal-related transcriptional regulator n=1 Tax=Streptomyces roseoviridis TaxID=67361 RepID=A0ABV5QU44_9ACTN